MASYYKELLRWFRRLQPAKQPRNRAMWQELGREIQRVQPHLGRG